MEGTARFGLIAQKDIAKVYNELSREDINKFKSLPMFDIKSTSEYSEKFITTESAPGAKETAEFGVPEVANLGGGREIVLQDKRFTRGILVSETMRNRAKSNEEPIREFLTQESNAVLKAFHNTFITDLHGMINNGFTTTDVATPEGTALFGTHTWASTGRSFTNNATAALSTTAIDSAIENAGNLKDAEEIPMPVTYKYILVKTGGAAHREAKKLFAMDKIKPTTYGNINIYEDEYKIVTSPYITSGTAWYLFDVGSDSMYESPLYCGVTQAATWKAPHSDINESTRTNITSFWKKGIVKTPLNVYGSTGTV